MNFRLIRTLPTGEERTHEGLASKRDAATAAAYVLTDNLGVARRDAEMRVVELERCVLGTPVSAFGYTFRVVSV